MKKYTIIIAGSIMALSLGACGGSSTSSKSEATTTTTTASSSTATTSAATTTNTPDLSNPDIIIEFGDYDGITALGKKLQNFEVSEGTVIKVTGLYEKNTSTPSIMEANEAGDKKMGFSMYLADGIEEPANDTKIEAVGVVEIGQYNMEFHIPEEGFTVLE